jgi:hypothetical protein
MRFSSKGEVVMNHQNLLLERLNAVGGSLEASVVRLMRDGIVQFGGIIRASQIVMLMFVSSLVFTVC